MMQAKSVKKTSRNQYTPEFRQQALALADRTGVAKAAREPGLHDSKRQLAERDEELAILQKAATYFAKRLK